MLHQQTFRMFRVAKAELSADFTVSNTNWHFSGFVSLQLLSYVSRASFSISSTSKTLHVLSVLQVIFTTSWDVWGQQQTSGGDFKPNVIFIRLFLYKKHWITGKNKPKKHASIYSMARDGKERSRGVAPVRILKTLIKHCALIYFDDIFHISQRRRTSALFHIEVKHRKKYSAVFKTRTVRSKLSTTVTEESGELSRRDGRGVHAGWNEEFTPAETSCGRSLRGPLSLVSLKNGFA